MKQNKSNPVSARVSKIGGRLRGGEAKASKAVATYGPACGTGALTGAWAGGAPGATGGCVGSVVLQIAKSHGPSNVRRLATGVDVVTTVVDIRRGAYRRLGIPTYREILQMWKAAQR